MSEIAIQRDIETEQPHLATSYVMFLFGLMLCALLLTAYYVFAIRVGAFTDQTQTMKGGGWIVVSISAFCIFGIVCAMRFNIVAFPVIFIASCFMFNLGKFMFMILEGTHQVGWYIKSIPARYYIEALPVVGVSFTALLLGVIVASLQNEKKRILHGHRPEPLNLDSDRVRVLRHIGYALYFLAVALTFYYALRGTGIAHAIRYGYATGSGEGFASATVAGEIPALATASLFWFAPWASLILLSTAKGVWERRLVVLLTLFSCGLTMLAGDRFVPIALFLGIMSIRHLRGQKIQLWQISVVLLAIFFIISTWSRIRVVSIQDWDLELFAEVTTKTATGEYESNQVQKQFNNPVSRIFGQMGQSYLILPGTMKQIDDGQSYNYGIDYIRMMGSAIPFAGRYLVQWRQTPSEWFDDQYLNIDSLRGLGFSMAAEAYLQGGTTAVILVHFILGFGMTAVWFGLERRPQANWLAYVMIIIGSTYIWVRDDMTEIAKPAVWGFGLTFIIPFIVIHAMKQIEADRDSA